MTTLDESLFDLDDAEHAEAVDDEPQVQESGARVRAARAARGASGEGEPGSASASAGESPARIAPSRWVREARFREKLRGYHQSDVDAFLDQVSFAFDELESRLRDAEERAARAAGEAAVAVADDETVRRTLTLAQRTAELAIAEAERQASELVERARAECEVMIAEAEEQAATIRERERSKLIAELTHLESARVVAAEDLDALEARRRREHERLTAVLRELAEVVEQRLS